MWGCIPCKTSPDHLKHEAKERQKDLIHPLTLSTTFALATGSRDEQGYSHVCVYEPRGQAMGFRDSFCGNSPWSRSPRLDGWSEQPEGRSSCERFLSKWQKNLPQSKTSLFPRPFASGSSRASASQGLSPSYWCPLPTSGRRISLMGAARRGRTPGVCQRVLEGLKHTFEPILWGRKLLPSPQSDRVPYAAMYWQRDDMVAIKS